MKIYTRTGDTGTTSLVGGTRVSKSSPRLEAYGTVDELNSHLGLLLSLPGIPDDHRSVLTYIQHRLFNLGSVLATEPESKYQPQGITADDISAVENAIERADSLLPAKFQFILPGGLTAAAQANVARTVARRAERRMIALTHDNIPVAPESLRFINRISDYLFVLGRLINHLAGRQETVWNKDPEI